MLDEVTTHLYADTVLALTDTLQEYQGALLVITHDRCVSLRLALADDLWVLRFFMRCLVEGESPYEEAGESYGEEEEKEARRQWQSKPGVVYHLVNGELKALDGGMRNYESIAAKTSKKWESSDR